MAKFVYICNSDGALYKFRYPLIKSLIDEGHEVHTISSPESPEGSFIAQLQELGVITHTLDFDGRNASFLHAISLINNIKKILKEIKPHYVHCFTHKANILGGLANIISKQKNKMYFSITGAGLVYTEKSAKFIIIKKLFNFLYKGLSYKFETAFFQNPDDMELFVKSNVFSANSVCLTSGSGLDLSSIELTEKSKLDALKKKLSSDDKIVILYPSRALYEKGVREFYEAAEKVSLLSDKFTFVHLGSPANDSASGFESAQLEEAQDIVYLGHKKSIYEYINVADVVVLPSYREGTPRAIIEALYFDKFIITSDAPGCRETLIDGWNGLLVKARDSNSLVSAFMKLGSLDLSLYKGRSHLLFNQKYDSSHIVKKTFNEYFNNG
jgi:N,N'-diacetylbacillosaminyl-diphospho-undecaprenol alpha-1,3-N-acetylgalactosaminyltransferase